VDFSTRSLILIPVPRLFGFIADRHDAFRAFFKNRNPGAERSGHAFLKEQNWLRNCNPSGWTIYWRIMFLPILPGTYLELHYLPALVHLVGADQRSECWCVLKCSLEVIKRSKRSLHDTPGYRCSQGISLRHYYTVKSMLFQQ
jgi:hypothetical protein